MRQCPTLAGDDRPLIAHSIANALCAKRQREFYHKCHRCIFRGKPMDQEAPAPEVAVRQNGRVAAPVRLDVVPTTRG